jgi:glycosyltransferase involved in cell wall biosynthesis
MINNASTESRLVSIGIPVRNGMPHIEEALRDLLSQDYANIEIIVSDNCSTDGTRELLQRYAESHSQIRLILNEVDQGPFRNFNRVLEEANGDYFCWHAHDDRRSKVAISTLVGVLDSISEVDLVSSYYEVIDNSDDSRRLIRPNMVSFRRPWLNYISQVFCEDPAAFYGLHRLAVLREFGIQNHDYSDVNLVHKYAINGRVAVIPNVLFGYGTWGERVPYGIDSVYITSQKFLAEERKLLRKTMSPTAERFCFWILRAVTRRTVRRQNQLISKHL